MKNDVISVYLEGIRIILYTLEKYNSFPPKWH